LSAKLNTKAAKAIIYNNNERHTHAWKLTQTYTHTYLHTPSPTTV